MTLSPREVLDRLQVLQALDRKLAAFDREIVGGPRAVEGFTRAVAAVDATIAQIDERTKLLRAQVKLRENEAKTHETRVEKLQDQSSGVKTNKEFATLRSEIANAKLEVTRVEDEILKIMEAVEVQEKLLASAKADRAREAKRLEVEKAKVDAAIDGLRASRELLAKDRPPLFVGIPPESLSIYERVVKVRGNAVVALEGEYCSGCMERLTKNDISAVHTVSRLIQCKSCSRILY